MSRFPSCWCAECVACCQRLPGWLTPRDVLRLARYLGVTPQSLFETHLAWDYWCEDGDLPRTWVPVPANAECAPGNEMPWSMGRRARCDQLTTKGLCSIHEAKPRECAEALPCQERGRGIRRRRIARAWNRPTAKQFRVALGRGDDDKGG